MHNVYPDNRRPGPEDFSRPPRDGYLAAGRLAVSMVRPLVVLVGHGGVALHLLMR